MFLRVINSRGWDGGCGSQTPVHPDTTGNLEELRTGPGGVGNPVELRVVLGVLRELLQET